MELTLREYKNALVFDSNYELKKEPLRADLLVIKKSPEEHIQKTIADIFRIYNIWEYKGFGDELNIDTLSKLIAYTTLYKSQGSTVDAIPFSEITASICRYEYPRKLFEDFRMFMEQTFADQGDKNNASALADVVLSGNPELLQKLKEDDEMHKAVEEFLKLTIDERIDKMQIDNIRNIMDSLKYTPQQAMYLLKIPPADQPKYQDRL